MIVRNPDVTKEVMALLELADPEPIYITQALQKGQLMAYLHKLQVVGALVWLKRSPDVCEITHLAVSPQMENQHIATRLLEAAIKDVQAQGCHTVQIKTGSTSIKQLYLYQKIGFRMTAIARDYFTLHYAEPIYENGLRLYDQITLEYVV